MSVSPVLETGGGGEDSGSEVDGELEGEAGERLKLPKEDEVVKHVRDPKLPTQEEVDRHYVMGHILFRDWRPVCVKSQG